MKKLLLSLLVVLFLLTGCSNSSPKGTWELSSIKVDGVSQNIDEYLYGFRVYYVLQDNSKGYVVITYDDVVVPQDLTWELSSDKKSLTIVTGGSTTTFAYDGNSLNLSVDSTTSAYTRSSRTFTDSELSK